MCHGLFTHGDLIVPCEKIQEQKMNYSPTSAEECLATETSTTGGSRARDYYAKLFKNKWEKSMAMITHLSESLTLDSIEYFLFPNAFFFPGLSLPMVYRFRPDPESPDYCYFDLIFMRPRPSDGKAPDPPEVTTLDINESYSTVEGVGPLGKITTKIPQILQRKLEDLKQA